MSLEAVLQEIRKSNLEHSRQIRDDNKRNRKLFRSLGLTWVDVPDYPMMRDAEQRQKAHENFNQKLLEVCPEIKDYLR